MFPTFVFSQNDFINGYIITNNFDTLNGYINNNANKYYQCKFKKSLDSGSITYSPFEIYGYRLINGSFFISKKITIKNNYEKFIQYVFSDPAKGRIFDKSWYSDTTEKTENIFINYILSGKFSLFYFNDKTGDHYFIEKENESIIDLTPDKLLLINNGVLIGTKEDNRYKGKLLAVMEDCPQLKDEIKKVDLNHKDLIKLAKDYHNLVCNENSCVVYEHPILPKSLTYTFYGGLSFSHYSNRTLSGDQQINYYDDGYFVIGTSLSFKNFIPEKEKLSFKINLDFCHNNYLGKFLYTNSQYDLSLSYNCINSGILLVENLSTKFRSPYIEFGLNATYAFDKKDNFSTYNFSDIVKNSFDNIQVGINLGIGYEFPLDINKSNKIHIEILHKQMVQQYNTNIIVGYEF